MGFKVKMNHKYKALLKDTFIFALGSVGSKIIIFFLVPLYTNCLTTAQYGTADLVFTTAQIFIPIISLVIFDAVIRFGLERRDHPENVLLVALFILGIGSLLSIALIPACNLYSAISDWKWYLYFYIILNIFLSIVLNYLKVKGKNLIYSLSCILQTLALAILNIILLLVNNMGVQGYLLSNIAASVFAAIFSLLLGGVIEDVKKASYDRNLAKQMVAYSTPLIFNNLAWWVIQSSDKVMIEIILSETMLGLYTVATRIPSLINVIVSLFQQSWGISAIVEMDSENDKSFYSNVFKAFSTLVFFGAIVLNGIIKPFMKIYVGQDFYSAWTFVPFLVCAAAFSAIAAYFGSIYGALKKSLNNMASTVTAGILNIIVNFLLIPKIGVQGAVIGTLISYIYLAFFRMIDCLRFVEINVGRGKLLLNVLIVLAHAFCVTADQYVLLSTCVTIALYIIINRDTIIAAFRIILNKINWKGKC